MKKSKKFKKWQSENRFIKKQKRLNVEERIMGNAKEHCYTCKYAGYVFNENKLVFEPYCFNLSHMGKICNFSRVKWNDAFEVREMNYGSKK